MKGIILANGFVKRLYPLTMITHIAAEQEAYSYEKYEKYEKTFLDFMMITNAEKVFLIKSDLMYKSGYPYVASKLCTRPFEAINIE